MPSIRLMGSDNARYGDQEASELVFDRLDLHRFGLGGGISAVTTTWLETDKIPHILDARMRRSKEVTEEALLRVGL